MVMKTTNGFSVEKKSLNESISEIKNLRTSNAAKMKMLIDLGLMKGECAEILRLASAEARANRVVTPRFKFFFGVEIECVMNRYNFETIARRESLPYNYERYNHIDNREYFKFTTDSSIQRNPGDNVNDPIECVSPILEGEKKGFGKLEKCCKSLNEAGAYVNRSTGLHVHISTPNMTDEQYVNVFKNYKMLEGVIDTFMARSRRENNAHYARSLGNYNLDGCTRISDVARAIPTRYCKVNPHSYASHKTIEFRQHLGSTNFTKIKNWVNFCAKLVKYSKDNLLTGNVNSIDEIPFLSNEEKAYFNRRAQELA